jgi:hypothetical protein
MAVSSICKFTNTPEIEIQEQANVLDRKEKSWQTTGNGLI